MIKKAEILAELNRLYGGREGTMRLAFKDRGNDDPNHFQDYFKKYPAERLAAATFLKRLADKGYDIFRATSLVEGPNIYRALPSRMLSFEVDQTLDDDAWALLRKVQATIIDSGTPGHIHIEVHTDEDLSPDENARLTKHLASACGVTGHKESGGKTKPHEVLRFIGSDNTKPVYATPPGNPVRVVVREHGEVIGLERLRAILSAYDAPHEESPQSAGVEAHEVTRDQLPNKVRDWLDGVNDTGDRSEDHFALVGDMYQTVQAGKLTKEQALYVSVWLYEPIQAEDKWPRVEQRANDFHRAWSYHAREKAMTPKKEAPRASGQESAKGREELSSNTNRITRIWEYGDLMNTRFDPLKFTVRGLITRGATLVIGAPKVGKSFWLLNLVLAVASGREAFAHFETRKAAVLYLYLEGGGARSIQSRIVSQQDDLDEQLPIVFATGWETYDDGGIQTLNTWLTDHTDVGMVVIDTLAAFRGGGSSDRNPWKSDYKVLSELSELAHKHNCAIVVAHHDKKGEESDFVNSASGTKGLSAACDGIIKLERERNSPDGKMKFVGRELEDGFWNVVYEALSWKVVDAPALKKGAETLKAILEFVGGRHVTISEIVAALAAEYKPGAIRQCVYRAKRARHPRLIQDDDGRYYQP